MDDTARKIIKIANELTITQFVCDDDDIVAPRLPHIIYHNIQPSKGEIFLYHLLLHYGKFATQADLWNARTIQELFQNAKLLPSNAILNRNTI
jgi:hypothetical protein